MKKRCRWHEGFTTYGLGQDIMYYTEI